MNKTYRIKQHIKDQRGFTLSETMIALLIMVLVFGVVTAGIPPAINALSKIVDSSNAQLLMSTTMTRMRDELGKADDVSFSGNSISYTGSDGLKRVIESVDTGNAPGIYLNQYAGSATTPQLTTLLVSNEASNKNLYTTYQIDQVYANGVITISDLSVKKGSDTLLSIDTFKIRVLSDAQ